MLTARGRKSFAGDHQNNLFFLFLKARVPFLGLLVDRAEQCLQERYSPESPLVYVQYPPLSKGRLRR